MNVTTELRSLAERLKPRDIGFRLESIADDIDDTVEERLFELPLDANGRPMHLGDAALVADDDDAYDKNTVGIVSEICVGINEHGGEPSTDVTIETQQPHTYASKLLLRIDRDELEEMEDDSAERIVEDLVEMATSDEMYTDVDMANLIRRAIRLQD